MTATGAHAVPRLRGPRVAAAVAAVAVVASLVAWPAAAAAQTRGGTLKLIYAEPPHLNTAITSGTPAGVPGTQIFASLIQQDERFQPRPYLAERWTISPDGRTYTFHLVKGATFHDGKPITAEDVKFSLELIKANHPFGVAMHRALESVETPSPSTVVVRLAHSYPAFLSTLSPLLGPILPRHVYGSGEIKSHPANLKPVGSGPFRFGEWQRGRYLILERYDGFFRPGRPYLDRVILEFVPDPAARVAALETGATHLVPYNYAGLSDARRLGALPHLALITKGYEAVGSLTWIELNLRKKELADGRVRQALAHAVDRQLVATDIFLGFGRAADGPIVAASPFFNPRIRRYEHSLEKAGRLLDEAGYRKGADGTRFRLTLDWLPGTAEFRNLAEYVREQGKKIGVDFALRASPDFPTWAGRMASWEYDLSLDIVFNYPDPVIGVERTYISRNIQKAVWTNTMGYANPKVDELFAQAERETSPERRKALYGQIQEVLTAELPLIWLHESGFVTLAHRDLDGLPADVWGVLNPYDGVSFKKAR